jgi:archaeal flagellar protein FlaJ
MKNVDENKKNIGFFKEFIIAGQLSRLIVYISAIVPAIILVFLAFFELLDIINPLVIDIGGKETIFGTWYDYIVLAIIILSGIYGMYEFARIRKIHKIDARFPDFVRDLAESRRAGMTFTKAIMNSSKGSYGLLTPEIQNIARQISWGNSVEKALESFAKRVNTKLIRRTVSLIIEASRSGGNVADVLDAASRDAREIKLLDSERRASMLAYVAVVYVSMMVFMVIILVLSVSLIPNMVGENTFMAGSPSPGGSNTFSQETVSQMFYSAAIVQGIFMGLVAGVFEEGNIISGIKHVFIMSLITFIVFKVFMSV